MTKEWSRRGYESTQIAANYINFRPRPPQELADKILSFLKEKYDGPLNLCLDVGCGSGQCSLLYANHFEKVFGTDISSSQIQQAKLQNYPENLEFQVHPAEKIPAEDNSVQLVNSSVAAHWFDLAPFLKEVDRVLCTNGVVALSSYGARIDFTHPTKSGELCEALRSFYIGHLKPYWAEGMNLVENEYADIVLPYEDCVRGEIWKHETLTLTGLVHYFTSWCAYNNYCQANGETAGRKILEEFVTTCLNILESDQDPQEVEISFRRKYFFVMGRKK